MLNRAIKQVSACWYYSEFWAAKFSKYSFLNARRRSEPNQRAFLVCGDLRCPLTLEGADRIDFGVTLESSMHALRDPALKAAARMPLLDHYHPGMPFEIMESDVCRWLIVQPLIITVIGKAFFDCSLRFLMPQ